MNNHNFGSNPNLNDYFKLIKEDIYFSFNCHQVGEIISFDAGTQTAKIEIKMKAVRNDKLQDYPILVDCPIVVLSGGKGYLTFPVSAGDSCLVFFNDRDLDNWFVSGQSQAPNSVRKHSFSDAMAIVGIRHKGNAIGGYATDGIDIKYEATLISLKKGEITINNGAGTTIKVDSSGVAINTSAKIQMTAQEASIQATAKVDITAPAIALNGMVSAKSIATGGITGAGGGALSVNADLNSSGDVKAGSISLKNHKHAYTWTDGGGSGNTQPPQ
ncbi:MAG: hypothetical protein LBT79_07960 [Elusimicrobiota bacterium]|jgi:hypothetical protein|nr:hypothetical protein [Elusimicrobiota bacterium]